MTEQSSRADACTQNTDKNNLHHLKTFKKSKVKTTAVNTLICQIRQSHAENKLTPEEMSVISSLITALVKAKSPTTAEGK